MATGSSQNTWFLSPALTGNIQRNISIQLVQPLCPPALAAICTVPEFTGYAYNHYFFKCSKVYMEI